MKINYPRVKIDEDDNTVSSFSAGKRIDGLLANKTFFLSYGLDWIVVKDDQGQLCLVPLKKTG